VEYTKLPKEDLIEKPKDKELKGKWPSAGQVKFNNVTMAYRDDLDPSVRNLTFTVQPRMKVGIVGRTGAGKSSIF